MSKLCPNIVWNETHEIFADERTFGQQPVGIFIDINDTIYATSEGSNHVQMWLNGDKTKNAPIKGPWDKPYSIFVTDRTKHYFKIYSIGKYMWLVI